MVLMALFWAGAFVVGKLSISSVPPEIVAFLRFLIAGLVLLGLLAVRERQSLRLAKKDWLLVAGLGVSGIAAYNLLFFWGLRYGQASDGAMIIPTLNPLLTLFAAPLVLGEKLTSRKLLGAAISLCGQTLIFWGLLSTALQDPDRLRGDLFFVASAVMWSTYTILGRIAARRFTFLVFTIWGSVSGMIMLLFFALWTVRGSSGYTPFFWVNALYLGLGATVAGFLLWSRGIHRLGASRAAVFINLVPVFTVALAALFLGERPGWVQTLGMVIVMAGVYVVSTTPAPAKTESCTP